MGMEWIPPLAVLALTRDPAGTTWIVTRAAGHREDVP